MTYLFQNRLVFFVTTLLFIFSMFFANANMTSAASLPVTGYAWSDFLGWIHFNGSGYGVYEDSTNGLLSGYAWSPYFGWITFNQSELSGCPSGTCNAQVSSGSVTGWARSCAAYSDKNACSGSLDQGSGGWDGWIHLSGSGYGITSSNGCWSGYAYGSQNIGFIKFAGTAGDGYTYKVGDSTCGATCSNGANNYPTCSQCPNGLAYESSSCVACSNGGCTGPGGSSDNPTGSLVCNNGKDNPPACSTSIPTAALSANPATVDQGQSSTLTWSSTNATSCAGTGFVAGSTSGSRSTGVLNTIGVQNYQLVCTGEGGNSPAAFASVTVVAPSATIGADPDRVRTGDTTTISWSSTNVSSCVVSGSGLSSANTSGSQSVTINSQSTFTITCQTMGSPVTDSVTVNVLPLFEEF